MKKILLWDFDHTLAYRDGMWTQSLCSVLDRKGIEYVPSVIKDGFRTGLPWDYCGMAHSEYFEGLSWWDFVNRRIARILEDAGVGTQEAVQTALLFRAEYLKKSKWHLFDDTLEALNIASDKGYTNIILSNHTPELAELTDHLDISGYFEKIITSALTGFEKPDPRIFRHALSDENHSRCVMIGDNYEADVNGAIEFGLEAVLVRKENTRGYEKYSPDLRGIWKYIE